MTTQVAIGRSIEDFPAVEANDEDFLQCFAVDEISRHNKANN
jgi:hypothetical protein